MQYFIDQITGSNENLSTSNTFNIDVKTGIVTSSTVIPDTVKGFYTLVIRVMDEGKSIQITLYILFLNYFSKKKTFLYVLFD